MLRRYNGKREDGDKISPQKATEMAGIPVTKDEKFFIDDKEGVRYIPEYYNELRQKSLVEGDQKDIFLLNVYGPSDEAYTGFPISEYLDYNFDDDLSIRSVATILYTDRTYRSGQTSTETARTDEPFDDNSSLRTNETAVSYGSNYQQSGTFSSLSRPSNVPPLGLSSLKDKDRTRRSSINSSNMTGTNLYSKLGRGASRATRASGASGASGATGATKTQVPRATRNSVTGATGVSRATRNSVTGTTGATRAKRATRNSVTGTTGATRSRVSGTTGEGNITYRGFLREMENAGPFKERKNVKSGKGRGDLTKRKTGLPPWRKNTGVSATMTTRKPPQKRRQSNMNLGTAVAPEPPGYGGNNKGKGKVADTYSYGPYDEDDEELLRESGYYTINGRWYDPNVNPEPQSARPSTSYDTQSQFGKEVTEKKIKDFIIFSLGDESIDIQKQIDDIYNSMEMGIELTPEQKIIKILIDIIMYNEGGNKENVKKHIEKLQKNVRDSNNKQSVPDMVKVVANKFSKAVKGRWKAVKKYITSIFESNDDDGISRRGSEEDVINDVRLLDIASRAGMVMEEVEKIENRIKRQKQQQRQQRQQQRRKSSGSKGGKGGKR